MLLLKSIISCKSTMERFRTPRDFLFTDCISSMSILWFLFSTVVSEWFWGKNQMLSKVWAQIVKTMKLLLGQHGHRGISPRHFLNRQSSVTCMLQSKELLMAYPTIPVPHDSMREGWLGLQAPPQSIDTPLEKVETMEFFFLKTIIGTCSAPKMDLLWKFYE